MAKQKDERDEKLEALFARRHQTDQDLQNQPAAPEPPPTNDVSPIEVPSSVPGLRITANGRKLGKHKNPEWGKFTILLKKQTQKKSSRLAEDMKPKRDLSDITEELLSKWIEEQEKKAAR